MQPLSQPALRPAAPLWRVEFSASDQTKGLVTFADFMSVTDRTVGILFAVTSAIRTQLLCSVRKARVTPLRRPTHISPQAEYI